jgi:hypothetical protein
MNLKNKLFLLLLLFFTQFSVCQKQIDEEIIVLAEVFHKYHWTKENSEAFRKLESVQSTELAESKLFVEEIIKSNNDILNAKFTTKPSQSTLKLIYVILKVNYNMFEQKPVDNYKIISEVAKEKITDQELLTSYYRIIFGNLVNKNPDKDFSSINFNTDELNLISETEKAIFFFVAMERFGMNIWGYMNIANKKCDKVLEEIKLWPKFDGKTFDKVGTYNLLDFKFEIDKRKPKVSFKKYYSEKYNQAVGYYKECLN